MITCCKCQLELPDEAFPPAKSKLPRKRRCKKCRIAAAIIWHRESRARHRALGTPIKKKKKTELSYHSSSGGISSVMPAKQMPSIKQRYLSPLEWVLLSKLYSRKDLDGLTEDQILDIYWSLP